MIKKSYFADQTKIILPLVIILFLYLLDSTSRERFLSRQSSIAITNASRISLLILIFTFLMIIIYMCVPVIQNFRNFDTLNPFYLSSYVLFVLTPILIDKLFALSTFEYLNKMFRVSFIKPIFADLNTILTGIGCNSVNFIGDQITCDTQNDVLWNYPTILLKFRAFDIDSKLTFFLGYSFALLFIAALMLLKNLNAVQKISLAFMSFSPPLFLVVNRGNFDLLILICLALAGYLLNNNYRFSLEMSYALILFASMLKFYAIFALPMILVFNRKKKSVLYLTVFSLIFVLISFQDLRFLNRFVGKDMSGSFGFPVLISHLNGDPTSQLDLFNPGTLVILLLFGYYMYILRSRINSEMMDNYHNFVFLILSFTFFMTWFLASNYYYRLILLFFVIPFYFHRKSTSIENVIGIISLLTFYLSFRTFGIIMNIFIIPVLAFNMLVLHNSWKRVMK